MTDYDAGMFFTGNDIKAIRRAINGEGILSGLAISKSATANEFIVDSGTAAIDGTVYTVSSAQTVSFTSDASLFRKNLIYMDSDGSITTSQGTLSGVSPGGAEGKYTRTPLAPVLPSETLVIGEAWIPPGADYGTDCDVFSFDFRMNKTLGMVDVIGTDPSEIPLEVIGAPNQAVDLFAVKTSDGTAVMRVDETGEMHGSVLAAGDEYSTDMVKNEGETEHLAVDAMGRLIESPVDFCHFSEKKGWNPTLHFHSEFPFMPDSFWELGYNEATWSSDTRSWSLEQGWVNIATGGHLLSHQQFRNGRARFRLKGPKHTTAGTNWSVGLFQAEIETMALPGPWTDSHQFGGQCFMRVNYGDSQSVKCYTEDRNSNDDATVTGSMPTDYDTEEFILEIEKYEDMARFWLYNHTGSTTLLASFIPIVDQGFPFNPVTSCAIKNEGTTGTVSVKSMQFDPIIRGDGKAPRKTVCKEVTAGGELVFCGSSCVVDTIMIRNKWATVSGVVQLITNEPTPVIRYETNSIGPNNSVLLSLDGMAFRYGLKVYSEDVDATITSVGVYP